MTMIDSADFKSEDSGVPRTEAWLVCQYCKSEDTKEIAHGWWLCNKCKAMTRWKGLRGMENAGGQ